MRGSRESSIDRLGLRELGGAGGRRKVPLSGGGGASAAFSARARDGSAGLFVDGSIDRRIEVADFHLIAPGRC